jgi:hypothetical protein
MPKTTITSALNEPFMTLSTLATMLRPFHLLHLGFQTKLAPVLIHLRLVAEGLQLRQITQKTMTMTTTSR